MSITKEQLDTLCRIAEAAGREIMAVYEHGGETWQKDDASPLTEADLRADRAIRTGLEAHFPGVFILSEESVSSGPAAGDQFFLVDPLDGTKEFIARREEYTVNLALIEAGRPALGFVFLPARALLYRGCTGRFAERLRLDAGMPAEAARDITPIRARPAPASLVAAVSRSHLDPASEAFLARLPIAERFATGSSLKLTLLAEGAADVYPRLAPTHEWDIAAGHAVLAAAGGIVLRPDGAALTYGNGETGFLVPGFVAWGDPRAQR